MVMLVVNLIAMLEKKQDIFCKDFEFTLGEGKTDRHLSIFELAQGRRLAPDLADLWKEYTEYRQPNIAETTLRLNYKQIASHIEKLPCKEVTEANAAEILNYLLKHNSAYTAKRVITQLNACCMWACERHFLMVNPFEKMAETINNSKEKKEINPFTKEERDAIIQAFETHPIYCHYAAFVKFLFFTGCRTSEAVGLQWKHISENFCLITFSEAVVCVSSHKIRKDTKNHKSRKFPCNASLENLLCSIKPILCDPEMLVFPSLKGKEINAHTFNAMCWKGTKVHGKYQEGIVTRLVREGIVERYRPQYNTRHTFITLALENGLDAKDVGRLVGNTPEIIYQHYAGCNVSMLQVPEF
jgi:integrase